MSAVPTVTPDAGAAGTPVARERTRGTPGSGRGAVFPTLFMLAFLVYFLMPLGWLFIASTKSLDDLFSSFGLWFAGFNLFDNISETFSKSGGISWTWMRNTLMYSFVSAIGAALLAAAAGYGFAKFEFKGKNLLFWLVLGSVMVPTTALAIPTYLMFSKLGFTNNPLSVILPSLVSRSGST
jgi:multiple sugar transport system permease protein